MRAMVTGGAGFIVRTCARLPWEVGHGGEMVEYVSWGAWAIRAEARAAAGGGRTIHQRDIRHPGVVDLVVHRQPAVIFHLAAQIDVRVSVERPAFDADVNVIGSLRVLEGARAAGSDRVVFAASGGTLYGEADEGDLPLRESHPHRPLSPYGVSKRAVLDYLATYREVHTLEFCALALANVYGPRQDPHGEAGVVAIFANRLAAGEPATIFGDGEQTRDYVFVDDAVDAFVRAATKGGGLVCNVGTGQETSVNELYWTMAEAAGVEALPVYAPARPGELQRNALDVGRAEMQLGWRPWTELSEGAAAVLAAVRKRLADRPS